MAETKSTPSGSNRSPRQVFRLSPSMHFTERRGRTGYFFSLQARLTTAFFILVLVPAAILTYFNITSTRNALQNAANQALESAARQTAAVIDDFFGPRAIAISEKANDPVLQKYLSLSSEKQVGSADERFARNLINTYQMEDAYLNRYLEAYMLLDRNGKLLLDTSTETPVAGPAYLGLDKAEPKYFNFLIDPKIGKPFFTNVIFPPDTNKAYIYIVGRVPTTGEMLGILVARYSADVLEAFLEKNVDLAGTGSFPVLYDQNYLRLAHPKSIASIFKTVTPLDPGKIASLQQSYRLPNKPADQLSTNLPDLLAGLKQVDTANPYFTSQASGSTEARNAGSVVTLKNEYQAWIVTYVEPQSTFLAPVNEQVRNSALLTVAMVIVSLLVGSLISNRLTGPISNLTRVAEKVTAGDLWSKAPVESGEIGLLADAFNRMTAELRRTLSGLEQRVAERTADLAKASDQMKNRANQLQSIADMAHTIASVQDPDLLLKDVTGLISTRFGYYHVGIFLIDEASGYAVLRATNSEGGARMLERGHKLKVGQVGIVGFVTQTGEPRIALDVGQDAVFFDNPDLPDTRSEMALPLMVGERIIGALDVQSKQASAFSPDDYSVFNTLADQVAIAIENTRLFTETRNALREMQMVHSQYLQQAWGQEVKSRSSIGYQFDRGRVIPVDTSEAAGLWEHLSTEHPTLILPDSAPDAGLARVDELLAPITVRGQVIGVLNLAEPGELGQWTEDDINFVKSVADQIGLALENARLIEQTQRRAEREHLVADITSKLRASNDPQVILQTAAYELRQALRAKRAQISVQPAGSQAAPGGNGHETEPAPDQGRTGSEN